MMLEVVFCNVQKTVLLLGEDSRDQIIHNYPILQSAETACLFLWFDE